MTELVGDEDAAESLQKPPNRYQMFSDLEGPRQGARVVFSFLKEHFEVKSIPGLFLVGKEYKLLLGTITGDFEQEHNMRLQPLGQSMYVKH